MKNDIFEDIPCVQVKWRPNVPDSSKGVEDTSYLTQRGTIISSVHTNGSITHWQSSTGKIVGSIDGH